MTGREFCVPRRAPITRAAHFGGRPGLFRTRRPGPKSPTWPFDGPRVPAASTY